MRLFRDYPIKRKLTVIIMATSTAALLLACAAFVTCELVDSRQELVHEQETLARIIGANASVALLSKDPRAAEQILAALRTEPRVLAACIYNAADRPFATYQRAAAAQWLPPVPRPYGQTFVDHALVLYQPVVHQGKRAGTVLVISDDREMRGRLMGYGGIVGAVLLASLGVALLLSGRLQRLVSQPILDLAAAAKEVSLTKNYQARTIRSSADEVGSLIGAFNEMLGQIQTRERALQESENHFRSLIENASDLITIIDRDNRIRYESPSIERILGFTAEEMLGKFALDYVHADDVSVLLGELLRIAETPGGTAACEFRFRRKDGSWVCLEAMLKNLLHDPGVAGIVVNSRDITERTRMEEALAHERNLLHLLMDNVSGSIYFKDTAGRFTRVNQAMAPRFGLRDPAEVLGKRDADFFTAENAAGAYQAEQQIMTTGQPVLGKVVKETWQGGRVSWALISKMPLRDPRGQIIGTFGISNDVTALIETQQALEKTAAELQRSNNELEQFAYGASHDLQEPLRKIQAFGDRLKAKCAAALGEQGLDYLLRMQNAARRMQTLISDLLQFSRVTTKAQPFVAVDLEQVAREVLSDLEVHIEQVGARVEVSALPVVEADPLQMRQLLQNLIGNALKFHQPGRPPLIKVGGHGPNGDGPGAAGAAADQCQIIVADNGIGFAPEYADRIFVIFQRLHGRSEYEGTGVGLAICRKIAERHGGNITAQSSPGQGATFTVTLPVHHVKGEP